MKTVLVACGAAVATSTVVAKKIEKIANENGIECRTIQAKASEVIEKAREIKPDIIVCTCQIEGNLEIPVMNGRSFLTGINLAKTTETLVNILKK
ncbi:MAG: PTS galactitol transporter subunit IIB [Eubacterium sp.]